MRNGLLSIKNRHVGTSILELNICGAVPPYNHLLAGKLTALLMCSPQVAADYRARYGDMPSEIASQLKGEQVVRPAELVYIGTTALYTAGASQYNRLKLPAGLLREHAPETPIRFLGVTVGYGTSHISDATTDALEAATSNDFTDVNHVLGEGVSPKMRIIRRGLDALFRNGQRTLSDKMSKHQMQRLIYGVWLAENGRDYLLGRADKPSYIWDGALPPSEGTARIAAYWRARWLDSRIKHDPALAQLEKFRAEDILVSRELVGENGFDWAFTLIKATKQPIVAQANASTAAELAPDEHQRQLVRHLYRGATGYADDVPLDDLRRLHVRTRLDDVIAEHIRARRSVVLTGNPGDGKTHLLRILESEIVALGAVVERDASAVPNDVIAENWRQAVAAGKPYFIAINESVLFKLAAAYPDFAPLKEARQQVVNAIGYDAQPDPPIGNVVVLDLSHRHTLSRKLVNDVFNKLTDSAMLPLCAQCPVQGCDRERNRKLLHGNDNRVRDRLQAIFDAITRRGVHVTMRDLEGFVAYLLFADRDCATLLQQSDDADLALPQLPYRGQGPIFDAVRQTFDPARVCHPIFDDALLDNTLATADWWHADSAYSGSLDTQAVERFARRKREFYFYHRQGGALLQLAGDDEQAFAAFLAESDLRKALRNILKKLTIFFGRAPDDNHLPVWQSHRYDQSAQRILYAVQQRERKEFELLRPHLVRHMAAAFDLADDHRVLRLKGKPQASLRLDFALFRLLHQAELGLPILLLQPEATRRVWQFLEQLTDQEMALDEETVVQILDPVTGERFNVTVDVKSSRYLAIERRER
ncbi:MAG: Druantia anti-phage system protein DruA [Anaerolineae bacterium]